MSIEENKHLVRCNQDVHSNNELDRLAEVLSEDLLTPNIMPGIPHGVEGAKAAHRIMLVGFPDY